MHPPADPLSVTFAALADPTRRAILVRLSAGQASVNELAAPFAISLPAISKHLKVLERAGLIERGRDAQWRPCRLRAGPLKDVADWVEHYRRFWEESFDRLDQYLKELQATEARGEGAAEGAGAAAGGEPHRPPTQPQDSPATEPQADSPSTPPEENPHDDPK